MGLLESLAVLYVTDAANGILTRQRANFVPKDVAPGDDSNGSTGYIAMARRVLSMEGITGLSRGLSLAFVWAIMSIILDRVMKLVGLGSVHKFTQRFESRFTTVIDRRAKVCQKSLSVFRPIQTVKILFSSIELEQPWTLFLWNEATDALIARYVLGLVLEYARQHLRLHPPMWLNVAFGRGLYIIMVVVAIFVLTALDVVVTRLTVQPAGFQSPPAPPPAIEQLQFDEETELLLAAVGISAVQPPENVAVAPVGPPKVVRLRHETPRGAYASTLDCFQTVIDEEGYSALFRGWWVTALEVAWRIQGLK